MNLLFTIQNAALRGGDPHYIHRLLITHHASTPFADAFVSFIRREQSLNHSKECAHIYHDWQQHGEGTARVRLALLGH